MEVRAAYPDDFERVYPLLVSHDPRLPRDIWLRLFKRPWTAALDNYGYLLLDRSQCVGFVGTIFSRRLLGGHEYDCCNISTWVVREEFRNHSLSLVFPVLRRKDWLITNLTPSREVALIFRKLGFQELDAGFKLFLPFVQKRPSGCRILMQPEEIATYLNPRELQILNDHLPFDCLNLLLLTPRGSCYLVATRVLKKKVPLARINYIGNLKILQENMGSVVNTLAIRRRVSAVIVDDRLLSPGDHRRAFSCGFKQPRLYKGFSGDPRLLDNLYSELPILAI